MDSMDTWHTQYTRLCAIWLALWIALAFTLALPASAQTPSATQELKIAWPVDVPAWDPTSVTYPPGQSLFKAVFDSPLFIDGDLKVQPRQIESWRWLDEIGTRLQINLRPDIVFHDGSPLTAHDLKFTFERIPEGRGMPLNGMMPTLIRVEVTGTHQAVMLFSKPTPTAPQSLAFMSAYILPKAYIEKVGIDGFLKQPIGAGPYRLISYQRNSRLTLQAFEQYWGDKPKIGRIIVEIVPDASARVAAVESGRVDVAVQIPVREVKRLQASPRLLANTYPHSEIYLLQIPSYRDTFQNPDLRRAMHLAIDKAALSRAFYNNVAQPISLLTTKGAPADTPGFIIPFDQQAAIEALARAGYSRQNPLRLRLFSTNNTFPSDYDMARAIAQMWHQIGLETTVEEITTAKFLELSDAGKLDGVMLYSWANATGDPEMYAGRILDPNLRFSTWKEPALADELDALNAQLDEEKRLQGYRELMLKAAQNDWSLPLLQSIATVVHDHKLNLPTYQTGYLMMQEISWQ